MKVEIIRPKDLSEEKWDTLERYLLDHYRRAKDSRSEQVDGKYDIWEKNYYGIPAEKIRTVPWYKSSNFVVKVIRIFVDTFCARTLNIIFATRPLYTVDGYPSEVKEALELYLNRKALCEWDHYQLASSLLSRGNKNGTGICKTRYSEKLGIDVMPGEGGASSKESEVILFSGPKTSIIPFEDFCLYPITANYLEEAVIKFHTVRYVEEEALRQIKGGKWELTEEELEQALKTPADAKREGTQEESGVVDRYLKELQVVECHLEWDFNEANKYYSLVCLLVPTLDKMIDCYYNPYPRNLECFTDYRPNPKEDFFYGESMCELLASTQEEISSIHNDRRNNSFVANAPVFKRRSGSLLPNPSTNWYPGKVFDLEDMNDFEMVMTGRNYNDTLQEEAADLQYAERLIGLGPIMQGMAQGAVGKKGAYNTGGTIALLSESNQRQDSNIRDFRQVLSRVAKVAYSLQSFYGKDDPTIAVFPQEIQRQIRAALAMTTPAHLATANFEVKASNAGHNSEVAKANLLQMASVLGQYGNSAQQMIQALVQPNLNPSLRMIINDTLKMQSWMAKRLLRGWDEYDAEEILPDARAAIEATIPGGGRGTRESTGQANQSQLDFGGAGDTGAPLSREGLQSLSEMLTKPGGRPQ